MQTKIIYFLDPICSACWGIEPEFKRLLASFDIEVEYHFGGLLENLQNSSIKTASGILEHWDEMSAYYKMPINTKSIQKNMISSSYPASIALKSAFLQGKGTEFLRLVRHALFIFGLDISNNDVLEFLASSIELNLDLSLGADEFAKDLALARQMGVRGFPCLFFVKNDKSVLSYGYRPFSKLQTSLLSLEENAAQINYSKLPKDIFNAHLALSLKEFSTLIQEDSQTALKILQELKQEKTVQEISINSAKLWVQTPYFEQVYAKIIAKFKECC